MKLEKLIKLAGNNNFITIGRDGAKWFSDGNAAIKLPEDSNITGYEKTVPNHIWDAVEEDYLHDECRLVHAELMRPDGGIKDCLRIYSNSEGTRDITIANKYYELLEKGDISYMYTKGVSSGECHTMIVKSDNQPVGVIMAFVRDFGESKKSARRRRA